MSVVSYLAPIFTVQAHVVWQRQKDSDCSRTELRLRSNLDDVVLRSPDPVGDPCVTQRLDWTARQKRKQPLRAGSYTRSYGLTLHQQCM